ncbi:MAG: TIGR04255 family protein [Treponematales bacterium]
MALKVYERVHYKKNPLLEVICQVRFPRILSIDGEVPSAFQNRIKEQFPILQATNEYQQQFSVDMTDDNPMPRVTQSDKRPNYAFVSSDAFWKVNLTSTFLSLSTIKYSSWEDFYGKLTSVIDVFQEIYPSPFYERLGLRYIDAFTRSKLNLVGTDWNELINPFALGFLSNPDIKDSIKSLNCLAEFEAEQNIYARVNTSLGYIDSNNGGVQIPGKELSFIVDSDIFSFNVKKENSVSLFESLHKVSTNIIRSVITDTLHNVLEPEKIEN